MSAQPLQLHEAEAMKSDPDIVSNVIKSYELMLDFYGMQLQSTETGLLKRTDEDKKWCERYRNLTRE